MVNLIVTILDEHQFNVLFRNLHIKKYLKIEVLDGYMF